jgi:molecular chaperone GrpE (heat shock protein)
MNEKDLVKKWNNRKLIEETISSMSEHNNPNPETRERLAKLETNHCNIMEKLDEIVERFNNFENKLDKALEKKADVWVEKAVSWAGYTVVGSVILALLAIVIKQ